MESKLIACSHPGKMGDCLYSIPAVKELCRKHGCKCDFYTSEWCLGLVPLIEKQSFVNRCIIPRGYIGTDHIGIHPVDMPIPGGYEAVYQLGYREMPYEFLPDYICHSCGLNPQPLKLDYDKSDIKGRYIAVDGKCALMHPAFFDVLLKETSGCRAFDVGSSDMPTSDVPGVIDGSVGFIGTSSLPLAIATFIHGVKRFVIVNTGTWTIHLNQGPDDMIVVVDSNPVEYARKAMRFLSI